MSDDKKTRSIELEIEVDAPKELVWRCLTNPADLACWFPPVSDGAGAKVGDKLLISWGKGMEWWTTVAEVEPGKHLRWLDDPEEYAKIQRGEADGPALAVDWFLETRAGKTVLRIVHSGFSAAAEWDDQFDGTEAGWRYFLFNLRHYAERHPGVPRVAVWERRKSSATRPDVWSRITADLLPSNDALRLGDERLPVVVEKRDEGRGLWLRLPSLNEALMFVELECGSGPSFSTGTYLSLYGVDAKRAEALREKLHASLDRVFEPATA